MEELIVRFFEHCNKVCGVNYGPAQRKKEVCVLGHQNEVLEVVKSFDPCY